MDDPVHIHAPDFRVHRGQQTEAVVQVQPGGDEAPVARHGHRRRQGMIRDRPHHVRRVSQSVRVDRRHPVVVGGPRCASAVPPDPAGAAGVARHVRPPVPAVGRDLDPVAGDAGAAGLRRVPPQVDRRLPEGRRMQPGRGRRAGGDPVPVPGPRPGTGRVDRRHPVAVPGRACQAGVLVGGARRTGVGLQHLPAIVVRPQHADLVAGDGAAAVVERRRPRHVHRVLAIRTRRHAGRNAGQTVCRCLRFVRPPGRAESVDRRNPVAPGLPLRQAGFPVGGDRGTGVVLQHEPLGGAGDLPGDPVAGDAAAADFERRLPRQVDRGLAAGGSRQLPRRGGLLPDEFIVDGEPRRQGIEVEIGGRLVRVGMGGAAVELVARRQGAEAAVPAQGLRCRALGAVGRRTGRDAYAAAHQDAELVACRVRGPTAVIQVGVAIRELVAVQIVDRRAGGGGFGVGAGVGAFGAAEHPEVAGVGLNGDVARPYVIDDVVVVDADVARAATERALGVHQRQQAEPVADAQAVRNQGPFAGHDREGGPGVVGDRNRHLRRRAGALRVDRPDAVVVGFSRQQTRVPVGGGGRVGVGLAW